MTKSAPQPVLFQTCVRACVCVCVCVCMHARRMSNVKPLKAVNYSEASCMETL